MDGRVELEEGVGQAGGGGLEEVVGFDEAVEQGVGVLGGRRQAVDLGEESFQGRHGRSPAKVFAPHHRGWEERTVEGKERLNGPCFATGLSRGLSNGPSIVDCFVFEFTHALMRKYKLYDCRFHF